MITLLISGCVPNDTTSTNISNNNQILSNDSCENNSFIIPDEQENPAYCSIDLLNSCKIKDEDDSFYFFREKVNFSELYPDAEIYEGVFDIKDEYGNPVWVDLINEDLTCFSSTYDEKLIYSYNILTKEYKTLTRVPDGSLPGLCTVNSKYLVWQESYDNSNWYKMKLHVYDLSINEDKVVYEYTTNPNTGVAYSWNWSIPVIVGEKLYFDDITNFNGTRFYVDMFCYDFTSGNVEKIQEQARWPMVYNNHLAWEENWDNVTQAGIYNYYNGKKYKIADIDTTYIGGFNTGGNLFAMLMDTNINYIKLVNPNAFLPTEEQYSVSNSVLAIYRNGENIPIMLTKQPTVIMEYPKTDGRYVIATTNAKHDPVVYDAKLDKIINFEFENKSDEYIHYLINEKYLVFFSIIENENDFQKYYYIDLSELDN